MLKVHNADAPDSGAYSCQAVKNGKSDTADFNVAVEIPAVPRVSVSPAKSIFNCKNGCNVRFNVQTTDGSVRSLIKKSLH